MKSRILTIKMNLLPWYNELDDQLEIDRHEFPELAREQIKAFGEYSIILISRYETRLRQISKNS